MSAVDYEALMEEIRVARAQILEDLGLSEAPRMPKIKRATRKRTTSSEQRRRNAAAAEVAAAAAAAEVAAALSAGRTRKQFRTNLRLLAEAGALPARHAIGAPRVRVEGHGAKNVRRHTTRRR